MGCDLTITNPQGMFIEETIHNGRWINPFSAIMNIVNFNPQFMPIHFNVVRNANDVLRRHRGHYFEVIRMIREIVGEVINDNDNEINNHINVHLRNALVIG
jgi:hypothetical protein